MAVSERDLINQRANEGINKKLSIYGCRAEFTEVNIHGMPERLTELFETLNVLKSQFPGANAQQLIDIVLSYKGQLDRKKLEIEGIGGLVSIAQSVLERKDR